MKHTMKHLEFIMLALTGLLVLGQPALSNDETLIPLLLENALENDSAYDEWYHGIYIGLAVGPQYRAKTDDKDGVLEFETGIVGSAALGYKLPEYQIGTLRFEFEYSRYNNSGDEIFLKSLPVPAWENTLDSEFDINSFMINVLFDFKIERSKFEPYIGIGAGISQVILDDFATPSLNFLYNSPTFPDGSANPYFNQEHVPYNGNTDFVGAVQFQFGVNYKLSDNIELFVGYKYFTSDKVEVVFQGFPNQANVNVHSGQFGLRFTF